MTRSYLALRIGRPRFIGDLTHWHYDTFRSTWRNPYMGWGMVTFYLNHRGQPSRMWTAGFGDFRRVDDAANTGPSR